MAIVVVGVVEAMLKITKIDMRSSCLGLYLSKGLVFLDAPW
jgi:hypothetical protein